ncbi:MAG: 4Fe-4S binding protein [Rhodocyclales bacterium GWA2_65_19]|nr:MAG: 4Fe-4S binding protein [Rhodocyclales bacterium GWA2_65_19]
MLQAKGIAILLLGWLVCLSAAAGELTRADIERRFQSPLRVGDKLREIAAWPLSSELTPDAGPVAYVFESIDLAPIPGFEGTPINLLVAIDASGRFIDVEVLRQHEPVFLGGLGPAPLNEFVKQYQGKNLKQQITVASIYGNSRADSSGQRVMLDGVTKATASVRIVNQSVLAAALAVARVRLGFADAGSGAPPARLKPQPFERLDFAALLKRGYVQRLALSNAEVEQLFADSEGAAADEEGLRQPGELFVEIYVAYLNAPNIGRNLLGDDAWAKFESYLQDQRPAFWVATRGRYALTDEAFVPGTAPPRLTLAQGDLPIELRDANRDYARAPALAELNAALILTAPAHAGLDPGRPLEFRFAVSRARGMILPVVTQKQIDLHYAPPAELFDYPPRPLPEWLQAWQGRLPDLLVIGAALLLLSGVLLRPRFISMRSRSLFWFRNGFLMFTLLFIGWYAQGQLSIVQITGAIKSLIAGGGLKSFLYDPVSLLLIGFTLLSFVVWGRGVFCGWLCPFGALQEFVALLAGALRVPQARLPPRLARLLERGRYALLALLLGAAALTPAVAERLVEIEPFKTAITVGFQRELPFLLWAVGLLLAGAFVYKFFCRFVCPLGAAMTLGGRLRRWNWLPRLAACGQPCQKCRNTCRYDAILPGGAIDYDECFGCLDCVGIYHDTRRCGPQRLQASKGRNIRIQPLRTAP